MRTVFNLAVSKLRYHKSRTLLTGLSIMLTTMLLAAVGTCGIAIFNMNRQMAVASGDVHASIRGLSQEQVDILKNHLQVEALSTLEEFAQIEYEKMNASLCYTETVKDGFRGDGQELTEGSMPLKPDEICSSPAFFERMGVEPKVGNQFTISFRVNGKGEVIDQEFVISGILKGFTLEEIEQIGIADSRMQYAGYISKALLEQYREQGLYEPRVRASIRVYGEDDLTYDEMIDRIDSTAADIGLTPEMIEMSVNYNKQYLSTMTDPGIETITIVAVICLIIIIFSALVIYSIYYVGVITDIQEIGKLKAMGASKRQIRRMLLWQGVMVSALAILPGLLTGYLLPYFLFPVVMNKMSSASLASAGYDLERIIGKVPMFSLPLLLLVAVVVLITVYLSLLKPMRMAARVSPIEAIRYQEGSAKAAKRKGHREVKVSTLTYANLTRNRKRTLVTMLTMGLSCVLFMCVAGVMSSMRTEDIARRNIPYGDFKIELDYSRNDGVYPENNLDRIVQQNLFSEEFVGQLMSIDGVEQVERNHGKILTSVGDVSGSKLYEEYENRVPFSYFTREEAEALKKELKRGDIDYDRMTANNEICFDNDYFFDYYELSLGEKYDLTVYDGDRQIPLTVTIGASSLLVDNVPRAEGATFVMTEDTWNSLGLSYDPTTSLYIHVRKDQYDAVKSRLQEIVDENPRFILYSMDEEMMIGRSSVSITKYPVYLILVLIAVIGFMNLINTMVTSIVTRKKELGILQAVGLSTKQLTRMLSGEGLVFTIGTLIISMTLGNLCGYLLYVYAKKEHFMSLTDYHYPLWESVGLAVLLLVGQLFVTLFINKKMARESLIERIRVEE